MNTMEVSRRLKIMAFAFLVLALILFGTAGFYAIINAKYYEQMGSSLLIHADFARKVLKSTASLFFVYIPMMAIVFIYSGFQLFRWHKVLDKNSK